jgi:hypothetical protein
MAQHPDNGMYSIKLVHPKHLDWWFTTPDVRDDGRQRYMNFSDDDRTRTIASSIRVGHRAIVYVTIWQKFIWAIEYTGGVEDGEPIAARSGLSAKWSKVFLPIRFLSMVSVETAPSAASVLAKAGVSFTPNAFPMKHISAKEYQKLFDAIEWVK